MTLQQIKDDITAAKNTKPELAGITSESKLSIWGAIRDVVATIIFIVYQFFDQYKIELQTIADRGYFGSAEWFVHEIKKFQFGHQLELINGVFQYAQTDTEAQIVHQVALETLGELINVKAARLLNNTLEPLTSEQRNALGVYINKIKFPGSFVNVTSLPPDMLILNYKIYYNAMLGESNVRTACTNTLNDYVTNIIFNGLFDVAKSIDELQKIAGVISPYLVSATGRDYLQPEPDAQPFTEFYTAVAGYMKIDVLTIELIPA